MVILAPLGRCFALSEGEFAPSGDSGWVDDWSWMTADLGDGTLSARYVRLLDRWLCYREMLRAWPLRLAISAATGTRSGGEFSIVPDTHDGRDRGQHDQVPKATQCIGCRL